MNDTVTYEVLETKTSDCGCIIQLVKSTWEGRTLRYRNFLYCPTHE